MEKSGQCANFCMQIKINYFCCVNEKLQQTTSAGYTSAAFSAGSECFHSFLDSGDLSSADNLCKQLGTRSGPTEFDTLIVFLKYFFLKS